MTSETKLNTAEVNTILQHIVGEYVWGVRCGPDRILQLEFGDPYLRIQQLPNTMESAYKTNGVPVNRTIAIPTGRWSLFIEDGLWTVSVNGSKCSRFDIEDQKITDIIMALNGQKLVKVVASTDNTSLLMKFDLNGQLMIEKNIDYCENEQWMIFTKGDGVLSFGAESGFTMEM